MSPPSSHFPDPMKKVMLQNALDRMKVFADVKTSEELDIAKGRKAINYHEYTNLIQTMSHRNKYGVMTQDNTGIKTNSR